MLLSILIITNKSKKEVKKKYRGENVKIFCEMEETKEVLHQIFHIFSILTYTIFFSFKKNLYHFQSFIASRRKFVMGF